MAKSGSNNIATILAIGALIWVAIITKMMLDMRSSLTQLESELALFQSRPMDPNAKADSGPLIVKVEDVKSPFISEDTSKKLKMRAGYYCLTNKVDDRVIIYFDGKDSLKTWSETDGTEKFVKSNAPDTTGTYAINSYNIFVKARDQEVERDFVLRGTILNAREDGFVTDFDLQDEVFATCPF